MGGTISTQKSSDSAERPENSQLRNITITCGLVPEVSNKTTPPRRSWEDADPFGPRIRSHLMHPQQKPISRKSEDNLIRMLNSEYEIYKLPNGWKPSRKKMKDAKIPFQELPENEKEDEKPLIFIEESFDDKSSPWKIDIIASADIYMATTGLRSERRHLDSLKLQRSDSYSKLEGSSEKKSHFSQRKWSRFRHEFSDTEYIEKGQFHDTTTHYRASDRGRRWGVATIPLTTTLYGDEFNKQKKTAITFDFPAYLRSKDLKEMAQNKRELYEKDLTLNEDDRTKWSIPSKAYSSIKNWRDFSSTSPEKSEFPSTGNWGDSMDNLQQSFEPLSYDSRGDSREHIDVGYIKRSSKIPLFLSQRKTRGKSTVRADFDVSKTPNQIDPNYASENRRRNKRYFTVMSNNEKEAFFPIRKNVSLKSEKVLRQPKDISKWKRVVKHNILGTESKRKQFINVLNWLHPQVEEEDVSEVADNVSRRSISDGMLFEKSKDYPQSDYFEPEIRDSEELSLEEREEMPLNDDYFNYTLQEQEASVSEIDEADGLSDWADALKKNGRSNWETVMKDKSEVKSFLKDEIVSPLSRAEPALSGKVKSALRLVTPKSASRGILKSTQSREREGISLKDDDLDYRLRRDNLQEEDFSVSEGDEAHALKKNGRSDRKTVMKDKSEVESFLKGEIVSPLSRAEPALSGKVKSALRLVTPKSASRGILKSTQSREIEGISLKDDDLDYRLRRENLQEEDFSVSEGDEAHALKKNGRSDRKTVIKDKSEVKSFLKDEIVSPLSRAEPALSGKVKSALRLVTPKSASRGILKSTQSREIEGISLKDDDLDYRLRRENLQEEDFSVSEGDEAHALKKNGRSNRKTVIKDKSEVESFLKGEIVSPLSRAEPALSGKVKSALRLVAPKSASSGTLKSTPKDSVVEPSLRSKVKTTLKDKVFKQDFRGIVKSAARDKMIALGAKNVEEKETGDDWKAKDELYAEYSSDGFARNSHSERAPSPSEEDEQQSWDENTSHLFQRNEGKLEINDISYRSIEDVTDEGKGSREDATKALIPLIKLERSSSVEISGRNSEEKKKWSKAQKGKRESEEQDIERSEDEENDEEDDQQSWDENMSHLFQRNEGKLEVNGISYRSIEDETDEGKGSREDATKALIPLIKLERSSSVEISGRNSEEKKKWSKAQKGKRESEEQDIERSEDEENDEEDDQQSWDENMSHLFQRNEGKLEVNGISYRSIEDETDEGKGSREDATKALIPLIKLERSSSVEISGRNSEEKKKWSKAQKGKRESEEQDIEGSEDEEDDEGKLTTRNKNWRMSKNKLKYINRKGNRKQNDEAEESDGEYATKYSGLLSKGKNILTQMKKNQNNGRRIKESRAQYEGQTPEWFVQSSGSQVQDMGGKVIGEKDGVKANASSVERNRQMSVISEEKSDAYSTEPFDDNGEFREVEKVSSNLKMVESFSLSKSALKLNALHSEDGKFGEDGAVEPSNFEVTRRKMAIPTSESNEYPLGEAKGSPSDRMGQSIRKRKNLFKNTSTKVKSQIGGLEAEGFQQLDVKKLYSSKGNESVQVDVNSADTSPKHRLRNRKKSIKAVKSDVAETAIQNSDSRPSRLDVSVKNNDVHHKHNLKIKRSAKIKSESPPDFPLYSDESKEDPNGVKSIKHSRSKSNRETNRAFKDDAMSLPKNDFREEKGKHKQPEDIERKYSKVMSELSAQLSRDIIEEKQEQNRNGKEGEQTNAVNKFTSEERIEHFLSECPLPEQENAYVKLPLITDPTMGLICNLSILNSEEKEKLAVDWRIFARYADEMSTISHLQSENTPNAVLLGGINPNSIRDYAIGGSVFCYNFKTDSWKFFGLMPEPRSFHAAAVLQDYIYVTGGYCPFTRMERELVATATAYRLHIQRNNWERIADLHHPRVYHGIAAFEDQLYVFGGRDDVGRILALVEVYNPEKNTWSEISPMPLPLMGVGITNMENRIWLVGGITTFTANENSSPLVNVVYSFQPDNEIWEQHEPLPNLQAFSTVDSLGSVLWVSGGCSPDTNQSLVSRSLLSAFSLKTSQWTKVFLMDTPRHAASSCTLGDSIMIAGGMSSFQKCAVSEVIVYSPHDQTLRKVAPLPHPVTGSALVEIPEGSKRKARSRKVSPQPKNFREELEGIYREKARKLAEQQIRTVLIDHHTELKPILTADEEKQFHKDVITPGDYHQDCGDYAEMKKNDVSDLLSPRQKSAIENCSGDTRQITMLPPHFDHRIVLKEECWKRPIDRMLDVPPTVASLLPAPRIQDPKKPLFLMLGGLDVTSPETTSHGRAVLVYNYTAKIWEFGCLIPEPCFYHGAAYFRGMVYVTGGYDLNSSGEEMRAKRTVYALDLVSRRWTQKADMGCARACHGQAVVNNRLYVLGGQDEEKSLLNSVEEYDPEKDMWFFRSPLPEPFMGAAVCVHKSRLWAIGGFSGTSVSQNVWRYHPRTNRWKPMIRLEVGCAFASAVSTGKWMWLCGGCNDYTSLNTIHLYDDKVKQWRTIGRLFISRHAAAAVALGEKIYMAGGMSSKGQNCLSSMELFPLPPTSVDMCRPAALPAPLTGLTAILVPARNA